jgi:hypothetical protein
MRVRVRVDIAHLEAGALVAVIVILVCREVVCWYFKLNRIADALESIEARLKAIHADTYATATATALVAAGSPRGAAEEDASGSAPAASSPCTDAERERPAVRSSARCDNRHDQRGDLRAGQHRQAGRGQASPRD